MDLGFETIGNATLICHDGGPLLVTDPWLEGPAYFGSWIHSHAIPEEQRANALAARFVWLSHGHPDHLSHASLEHLRGKPILLGDHYGGRIAEGLRAEGHEVRVLEPGKWTRLSPRLRVLCVPDYGQDSVLLLDFDGRLVVDANDASDRGVGAVLRETVARYERSWLACLTGYGDADMINFFDEAGRRVLPFAAKKQPVGPGILEILRLYGIKTFVPSSSMHKYQRADSVWANEYRTPEDVYARGFESAQHEMLPAFVRFDLLRQEYERIDPPENPDVALSPESFGDSWSEELDAEDVRVAREYFGRVEHLKSFLGYVNLRVGGKDNVIDVARASFDRGLTFEAPRSSLMAALRGRFFDDVLIGNFVRTTLHGQWHEQGAGALYPDFTPFVTKYGDNGGAYTRAELCAYFRFYRERCSAGPGPSASTRASWASLAPYL